MSDDDARRDGFADLDQLQAALDRHYPGLGGGDAVDIVSFTLTSASQD